MSMSGRDHAPGTDESAQEAPTDALALMERALGILDANGGPVDVGAHLDLAIERLKDWLERAQS